MEKVKKILIYGIGSLQNRGCEALVNSTIAQIDPNLDIVAATFDYEHDKDMYKDRIKYFVDHHKQKEEDFTEEEKKEYERIQNIPFDYNNYEWFYERDVIKEMQDADLCIHIGGDNYCYGVNEWMFAINTKAKEMNKKTVLRGASLFDEIKDLELINDLKKYDLLMIREKISYNAVKKYIDEDRLMLVPDPAFSLIPQKVKLAKWYKGRKVIGLNLSPLTVKTKENEVAIKKFIDYILNETDYSLALLPHVAVEEVSDLSVLKKIKEEYNEEDRIFLDEGEYTCQEIKYIISQCDLLVAARTHASIAAYSTLIPTLVIGYSVKSRGIAESLFGNYQDYVLPTEELKEDELINKFKYIEKNKKQIKETLEEKMKVVKEDAKNLYNKMIERLDYLDKKYVCPKDKCTGCSACLNICPVDAITFVKNKEGFLYPEINLDKCIHCNKCRNNCIALHSEKNKNDKVEAYAVKAKEDKIRKVSSSGGVFHYLAKEILDQKGIVYGAELERFKVKHIRVDNADDLVRIKGSKYAQSNLEKTFQQVEKDLANKKKVLFSGTPCQILGLKKYLKKDYKNLYTVSVICHGVINDDLLKKRISEFERQFDTKMNRVKYRSKINGWDKSTIEFDSERIRKSYTFTEDPLMDLYINNFILRESCYDCPAKGLDKNVADIILGDYWGIYHVDREFFDNLGVSAVIVKTEKGQKLYNKIKNFIVSKETDVSEIIKYNPSLVLSSKRPILRDKIFIDLEHNTLSMVYNNCKLQKELEKREEIEKIKSEKNALQEQLNQIYNSKRFKMVDKLGNMINKIRKKK